MAYNRLRINPRASAILTSIIYSDIFDFPLNRQELWKYLISDKKVSIKDFDANLQALKIGFISHHDGYFFLKGKERNVEIRKKYMPEVSRKLKIAKKAAYFISHIPSILFIGISGGLAMGDVDESDDIDFFIITKKNTIFKSRLLTLFTLQILNLRRKRIDYNPSNKVCINYLIDEESLPFSLQSQDVYTAHEIMQLKPLYDASGTFNKFIESNKWINNFFPNSNELTKRKIPKNKKNFIIKGVIMIMHYILPETLCKSVQIILINRNRKNELITNHILAFNPNDYRVQTLKKLNLKLREIGLLTKF